MNKKKFCLKSHFSWVQFYTFFLAFVSVLKTMYFHYFVWQTNVKYNLCFFSFFWKQKKGTINWKSSSAKEQIFIMNIYEYVILTLEIKCPLRVSACRTEKKILLFHLFKRNAAFSFNCFVWLSVFEWTKWKRLNCINYNRK